MLRTRAPLRGHSLPQRDGLDRRRDGRGSLALRDCGGFSSYGTVGYGCVATLRTDPTNSRMTDMTPATAVAPPDRPRHRRPDRRSPRHARRRPAVARPSRSLLAHLHRAAVPRRPRRDARSPGAAGSAGATSSSPLVMYVVTGLGITVGFHRLFTHKSFKPNRGVKIALARRRLAGHPGPGHPLGRRPPQAPQVLRPRRRPALPVALRRDASRR